MIDGLFFDLEKSIAGEFLEPTDRPWLVIRRLDMIILELIAHIPSDYTQVRGNVWIGRNVYIEKTALVEGPAIIGHHTQIRHGAFIRPNVVIGSNAVVGNATEIKNSILFDKVQVPHFNYVGDSILGYRAHLGAGAILSNFKNDGSEIDVHWEGSPNPSGSNKMGALIADEVEVGCNCVLFPGTVVGKGSILYPLSPVRGYIPPGMILKTDGKLYAKR